MSIGAQRLLAYMDQIARDAMRQGYLPDPSDVRKALNIFARRKLNAPSLQYRAQRPRGKFDLRAYNDMFKEILEDLQFAFAEQVDQANRLVRSVNEIEVRHGALASQVDRLDMRLDDLLLSEPGAHGYFLSVGDTFRDLSLVDQNATTAEVDLESQSIFLPVAASTRKIPLPHLAERSNVSLVSDVEIKSAGLLAGSRFGYAFDDTARAWQHRIVGFPGGWSGYVTLPVSMQSIGVEDSGQASVGQTRATREIYVSRIDINGWDGVEVKILYSLDGKNFLVLPDHDWVDLGTRRSIFFERIKMEFIRILMRKAQPDEESPDPIYIIGLSGVSLYDAGYSKEGTLISKELDPDSTNRIGRVVLDVDEHVPAGTAIDYYVSEYAVVPTWRAIQPASRIQPGASPILDLAQSVLSKGNRIDITVSPALNSTRNGISFYNIGSLNGSQIDETARLYRGVDGWFKTINETQETVDVADNYVLFTAHDGFQKLYIEMSEEVVPPASDGANPTAILLSRNVLDDPSLRVVPSGGAATFSPDYCVKRALLQMATPLSGSMTIQVNEDTLGVRTVIVQAMTGLSGWQISSEDMIYLVRGAVSKHFRVIRTSGSGALVLTIDDPLRELHTGAGTWSLDPIDVTSKIIATSGNAVTIASDVTLTTSDKIIIEYRSPLDDNEQLVTSSISVKDSSSGSAYTLGRDYTVDQTLKGINRNPDGGIAMTPDAQIVVRVDFQFKRTVQRTDVYTAFLRYDGDGSPLAFSALSVDASRGESIVLGNDDLSSIAVLTGLTSGWYRLTVRSRPALNTAGAVDTASAIYKAVNAVDSDGYLLFGPRHFAMQRAVLPPLKPVTLFYLQTSVPKDDRTAFAISGNSIVVNWDPTTNTDMIYLPAGGSTLQTREVFEVEYRYTAPGASSVTSLMFRAELSRQEGESADKTPVLRSYRLKLAH